MYNSASQILRVSQPVQARLRNLLRWIWKSQHRCCISRAPRIEKKIQKLEAFWTQPLHPGRLTWNIQITHFERKLIFQTSMIMFHVNLQGCSICLLIKLNVIESLQDWNHRASSAFWATRWVQRRIRLGFYSVYTYPIASMYGTFTYTFGWFLW